MRSRPTAFPAHRAWAAPASAVAELGVVRRLATSSMKARTALIATTKVLGFSAIALGCALAGLLTTPTKPLGSAGLYRDESYLVYGNTSGRGADFYFTPLTVVVGTSIVSSAVGLFLLWLSRRVSRSLTS